MMLSGGGGGGDNETLNRMNLMSSLQLNPATISSAGDITAATGMSMKKDDRVPQWSHQETRDFISIRAELERDFTVAKRNKTLWEIVSTKMKEKGYRRTPDQCKCKWKNLVNRYKGKETSDPENGRQCPFFDELHGVFTERAKSMHNLLIESEGGGGNVQGGKKKVKRVSGDRSSEEFSDEDDHDGEDDSEDEKLVKSSRKRKASKVQKNTAAAGTNSNGGTGIQEMLQEFFQQQHRIEMQWREMVERRALERRMFEQEWRQSMEKLERERLMVEQAWREREEQRRMREESRAEKRDALLTTLLNKLIREEDHHHQHRL